MLIPVPGAVRADFDALNQGMARMIVAKDYVRMNALMIDRFAPEFVWDKAMGQSVNLITMASGGETEMANQKAGRGDGPTSYKVALSDWKRTGDRITVSARLDVVGSWLQGSYRMPVRFKSLVRQTWELRGGHWLGVEFKDLRIDGKMGDQPVE